MLTIIIDEHIPFIKGVLEPYAKVIYVPGGIINRNMALKADGLIIRTRTRCNPELLMGTPVKFIASATIGYDHIDTDYCNANGIGWHYAPGCNSSSVKQYIASIFANLILKHGYSLEGKRIGIIGAGNVGSKVAELSLAFGMIPLLNDPPRARAEGPERYVSLDQIKESADIITFHVPLNRAGIDMTFHMADNEFFEKLSNKPLIINTSRGEVIDTESVKSALNTGKISGFAADVWENEPLLNLELMNMSMVATPHIAGYSVEGKANGTAACVNAANRYFGFGFADWYPPFLPSPVYPEISIASLNKNDEQVMAEAILSSYDVMQDDSSLRHEPSRFEHIRNHYPVRREFDTFKVLIDKPKPVIIKKLKALGFRLA